MTELTPLDIHADRPTLQGIETRVAGATPGPWGATYGPHEPSRVWTDNSDDAEPLAVLGGYVKDSDGSLDAALIAAAPTDLAALTAAVRAVLALHGTNGLPESDHYDCDPHECDRGGESGMEQVCEHCRDAWPCETVRALSAHLDLGIEVPR